MFYFVTVTQFWLSAAVQHDCLEGLVKGPSVSSVTMWRKPYLPYSNLAQMLMQSLIRCVGPKTRDLT